MKLYKKVVFVRSRGWLESIQHTLNYENVHFAARSKVNLELEGLEHKPNILSPRARFPFSTLNRLQFTQYFEWAFIQLN